MSLSQFTSTNNICYESKVMRRSANYQPSIWDYHFIQSLESQFGQLQGEQYVAKINKLKGEVKTMFEEAKNSYLDKLEMIDSMQRLGFAYHFEDEINEALKSLCNNGIQFASFAQKKLEDLHAIALAFRLLRQYGYEINQGIFNSFLDEQGNFKECLRDNLKGLINLYEASFLMIEGENILENAQKFTKTNLEKYLKEKDYEESYLSKVVSHALELPFHWRMQRLEARWFIHVYEHNEDMKPIFLELAKLDFNMVQAIHLEELKHLSRWWNRIGLGEKLGFARNRLVEVFFWSVGTTYEPQYRYCREILSKAATMVVTIDDIYDVYGTLDELELFTDIVMRWDINAMDQLPDYMKICFLAMYNTINEIAFNILKDQELNIISYLKKVWADVCTSYLLEARWFYDGYTPTLKEYLENGWISITIPMLLYHGYFATPNQMSKEVSEYLKEYPNVLKWASVIVRLADDLGTSSYEMKRGDTPKAIQCYMHESKASEETAREHMNYLIGEAWKKINEDQIQNTTLPEVFSNFAKGVARISLCIYKYGDGFGVNPNLETKDQVTSLFFQPISLINKEE